MRRPVRDPHPDHRFFQFTAAAFGDGLDQKLKQQAYPSRAFELHAPPECGSRQARISKLSFTLEPGVILLKLSGLWIARPGLQLFVTLDYPAVTPFCTVALAEFICDAGLRPPWRIKHENTVAFWIALCFKPGLTPRTPSCGWTAGERVSGLVSSRKPTRGGGCCPRARRPTTGATITTRCGATRTADSQHSGQHAAVRQQEPDERRRERSELPSALAELRPPESVRQYPGGSADYLLSHPGHAQFL